MRNDPVVDVSFNNCHTPQQLLKCRRIRDESFALLRELFMKVSKAQAEYQDYPDGNKQCSRCTMFVQPKTCTKVTGQIAPNGYCRRYYDPKDAASARDKRLEGTQL